VTGNPHYVSAEVRALACRTVGHEEPAALGLDSCPIPFAEVVAALCDLVEEQRSTIARLTGTNVDGTERR
jgi:hypothetical protein